VGMGMGGGAGWQVKRQEVSKYSNVCKMI